jgi:hypothetical protein
VSMDKIHLIHIDGVTVYKGQQVDIKASCVVADLMNGYLVDSGLQSHLQTTLGVKLVPVGSLGQRALVREGQIHDFDFLLQIEATGEPITDALLRDVHDDQKLYETFSTFLALANQPDSEVVRALANVGLGPLDVGVDIFGDPSQPLGKDGFRVSATSYKNRFCTQFE